MTSIADGVGPSPPQARSHAGPLLQLERLRKHFTVRRGMFGGRGSVHAVQDVSLQINAGETLGLVGESGCGKSTLGRVVLRLLAPTSGRVLYRGDDISALGQRALRPLRRKMQIIFQDPYGSLNPRMTVRQAVGEAMLVHGLLDKRRADEQVGELLARVGLRPDAMNRYPHEFSGGQRQRIGIARALAVQPEFIVADEPVSALDVSIQAQIVNLMMDLQQDFGLTYLLIAHDLELVRFMSHRVAVMYLGRLVEHAPARGIYDDPKHPYTQALLSAVPRVDPASRKRRLVLEGDVPSPIDPPAGCAFHPRCPLSKPGLCDREVPTLRELAPKHHVACHLAE